MSDVTQGPESMPSPEPSHQANRGLVGRGSGVVRKTALTTWEGIWYLIQNIYFGSGYLAKVPVKKAMQDFGLIEMTEGERTWYIVLCICFGAGYFAKIPTAKALLELQQFQSNGQSRLNPIAPIEA